MEVLLEPRQTALAHPRITLQHFLGFQQFHAPLSGVQVAHLALTHREGRAFHLCLVIIQRNQKLLTAGREDARHQCRVPLTHRVRQCDQRGAIIDRLAAENIGRTEREKVAATDLQGIGAIDLERPTLGNFSFELLLGEKRVYSLLTQLHPHDIEPLPGQPGQIQTLAAQRHQHRRTIRQRQSRPVATHAGMNIVKVETNLVASPALLPEVFVHLEISIMRMAAAYQSEVGALSPRRAMPRHPSRRRASAPACNAGCAH